MHYVIDKNAPSTINFDITLNDHYIYEIVDKKLEARDKSNKAYKWKNSSKGRRR